MKFCGQTPPPVQVQALWTYSLDCPTACSEVLWSQTPTSASTAIPTPVPLTVLVSALKFKLLCSLRPTKFCYAIINAKHRKKHTSIKNISKIYSPNFKRNLAKVKFEIIRHIPVTSRYSTFTPILQPTIFTISLHKYNHFHRCDGYADVLRTVEMNPDT